MLTRWRALYGASPMHLVALAASFALAAYAGSRLFTGGHLINIVAWFVFAIIGHDLVLVPLYSVLDRIAGIPARRLGRASINYVRVPALLSGLLALVYFPSILGLNSANYRADTSLSASVFLGRWLLISAGLFLASGLSYAVRARRRRTDAQAGEA